jgi:hypothetical protein
VQGCKGLTSNVLQRLLEARYNIFTEVKKILF